MYRRAAVRVCGMCNGCVEKALGLILFSLPVSHSVQRSSAAAAGAGSRQGGEQCPAAYVHHITQPSIRLPLRLSPPDGHAPLLS